MTQNIYADFGGIIEHRFISRNKITKEIQNRLLSTNFASMQITGIQKSGKSTLAYNLLEKNEDEFFNNKIIIIKINMSDYNSNPNPFFYDLVTRTYDFLEMNSISNKKVTDYYTKALAENYHLEGKAQALYNFFLAVKKLGYNVIVIIDEFDHARTLFHNYKKGFAILRSLANEPKYRIALLVLSRRRVQEIQLKTANESTFDGILGPDNYLCTYDEGELADYFEKISAYTEVTPDLIQYYKKYTGFMPYWMDIITSYLVQKINEAQPFEIKDAYSHYESLFMKEYNDLYRLLDEQGLLSTLFQIVYGPIDDIEHDDISKLLNYGVVTLEDEGYKVISEPLDHYFFLKQREFSFYPLWNMTEKKLREVCVNQFKHYYGEQWSIKLENKYKEVCKGKTKRFENGPPTIYGYIKSSKGVNQKFLKSNMPTGDIQLNFIDGMTTGGLFELMASEWNYFSQVFKGSKEEFVLKSKHITKARNPYQHNNDHLLRDDFKQTTKIYLEQLLNEINQYFTNKVSVV
ncbi:hypothetical protein [Bacillus cereus group sp. BfR-BA-01352]|uniref:hypothetical protein n=1 Tax=Bacillus cereus group sp. BfR-BA-01352 TaxID=2920315 RepID=UPI001F56F9C4|nr:hypothetical protein [Bacillus cereus group sp. BfR-BA-01352]